MPTFSSAPASVAFEKAASQPLGALSTGMGYDPATDVTATTATQYIGGEPQVIGYGKGEDAVQSDQRNTPHRGKAEK